MADLIDRAQLIELYRSQGDERADEFPQWDYFEAFERAIAALPAQGVRVKPLEWAGPSGDPEPWENCGWEQHAKSVAGLYRVLNRNGLWRAVIHCVEHAYFVSETDTLDAAKAAAQADYERRILDALTTENPNG